jgi:hypothetical protein
VLSASDDHPSGVTSRLRARSSAGLLTGPSPAQVDTTVHTVRQLMAGGELVEASRRLETLLVECRGVARPEVLLAHAELLLQRGRPASAERALLPLLLDAQPPRRARWLAAVAARELGDEERAVAWVEDTDVREESGPIEITLLAAAGGAEAERLRQADAARLRDELEAHPAFLGVPPYGLAGLLRFESAEARVAADPPRTEALAYYIGELCCRLFGATWRPTRRHGDGRVSVETARGRVELAPYTWARWREARVEHALLDLFAVLMRLRGHSDAEIREALGVGVPSAPPAPPDAAPHPLSVALVEALQVESGPRTEVVRALGLLSDSPTARVEVPLVVEGAHGARLVLFHTDLEQTPAFARYLDLLALGPFGRWPWQIEVRGGHLSEALRPYRHGDAALRAALVARRLCAEDPASNARWAVALAATFFDANLDGSLASLAEVDEIIDALRAGGPERWESVYEERGAILYLLTCYAGEVLRARVGGGWSRDRLTGAPMGPASGLERGDVTFNLGTSVLRRFHDGDDESLLQRARAYRERLAPGDDDQVNHE